MKLAMISGASRGIGKAIAAELLDAGWAVSLGLRDVSAAPFTGPNVLCSRYDALDPQSEAAWVDETRARFGRLDGLVLSAGIHSKTTVLDAGEDEFDRLMDVNVKSPMRLAQKAWGALAETGADKAEPGRIVLIASLSGKRIKSAKSGLYGMSKFALMGLAHGLRQSGRADRVRTTAICPSFVATDMAAGVLDDTAHLTQPEDLARIVRTVLDLPPSASIADIPVHYDVEDVY
ncbi:MAG: SDR family NAD(P)-dependent oxidoreductase [Pseudomonadota bacterium]|nr:SDR family NAD(P)-dependent oxidoreductase [Pseudomonadota bacterium]